MSSDEEQEGIRGRVDRFFSRQAKKRDELLDREAIGERLEEVRRTIAISSPEPLRKLAQKRRERTAAPEPAVAESSTDEVRIGPWSRSLVKLTTNQPPVTMGLMTALMFLMLIGIPQANINGAMEVYLPRGSPEEALLFEVREDWSTDIIVIYIETPNARDLNDETNITLRSVLIEMDYLERTLDFIGQIEEEDKPGVVPSDAGTIDDIVFSLSISTIIKELHSSNSRAYDALIDNGEEWAAAESGGISLLLEEAVDGVRDAKNLAILTGALGGYEIPSQSDIDDYVEDIPPSVMEKVLRDTNGDTIWDTAVIVFGISGDADPAVVIERTYQAIAGRGEGLGRPDGLTYSSMELTGPVPVTQAITERSFHEFWRVFPLGVGLCALMIFALHRRIRAVLIAGVPTLYGILITYGIIGWWGREVTPTIIALGPILMALGVAYGLHLTNRFTEEQGNAQERMMRAMSTTGRAIVLSAVTTMIGFGSLMYTNLDPVFTVGLSLTMGILICLLTTFVMAPAIAVWTNYDYHKTEGEWGTLARTVTDYNRPVLVVLLVLMLLSLGVLPLLETNIDYLEMVPRDEPTLVGIVKYSQNFNAGALGMMIVRGDFRNGFDPEEPDDAVDHLDQVDLLVAGKKDSTTQAGLNGVPDVTAIAVTDLMKTVKLQTNQSETLADALALVGLDSFERSFWEIIHDDWISDNDIFGRDVQKYLLNVFYDSLTEEALGMLMNEDYSKTLVYVDMPLKDIKGMESAVTGVNAVRDDWEYAPVQVSPLTGVAAIGTSVNAQLIKSQLQTLAICLILVFVILTITFGRNWKLGLVTTLPVMWVVALEPLTFVGLGQSLSLVTVMIGSIVIGVGIDFSIHITQRVVEGGINLPSVYRATARTAQTLGEATLVTLFGLMAAFAIKITALWWFVFIIMVLILASMIAAMFLLPALYATIIKAGGTLS
ncbi:MAG: MMPL family transporter [Candidatus Poseidoniia archaeon]|nr:MMPL family transporter [Candidatus Poseidoniia archaeon]MDP7082015.1 MMPL family transporter [Candidatus Poseidoniia archaeon]MDP7473702.1 MMPL family transporter [Candidatus Poseidoniia archaeon]MDP7589390.1 MMPL family transporter [Candidatus Poseidoniia archaeon]HJO27798.1 MMPL family transporter [Candidatus Poseidoniia archaeon]